MPWYLLVIGSVILSSFEEIADKLLRISKGYLVSPLMASFARNFTYFLYIILTGLIGLFGPLQFQFRIEFVFLAILWILNSLGYDYFLRKVELSRFSSIFYLIPLSFILFDISVFGTSFNVVQVISMILLSLGGLLMSYKFETGKFVLNRIGIMWVSVKIVAEILFLFFFKKLNLIGINEISFLYNTWIYVVAGFTIFHLFNYLNRPTQITRKHIRFISATFVSKGFDFFSGVLYLFAVSKAPLSSVSSLYSISPVVLLIVLKLLPRKTRSFEDLTKSTFRIKLLAVILLCVGGVVLSVSTK